MSYSLPYVAVLGGAAVLEVGKLITKRDSGPGDTEEYQRKEKQLKKLLQVQKGCSSGVVTVLTLDPQIVLNHCCT